MSKECVSRNRIEFTDMMKGFLGTGASLFTSSDRMTSIVFANTNNEAGTMYLTENVFMAEKARPFQQLSMRGRAGSAEHYSAGYSHPDGREMKLLVSGEHVTIVWSDRALDTFTQLEKIHGPDLTRFQYVPLPDERQPEYLFRTEDGRIIYVDAPRYNYSFDRMRMFVIDAGRVQQAQINEFQRLKDGGTTVITSDLVSLYAPSPAIGKKPFCAMIAYYASQMFERSKHRLDSSIFRELEEIHCRNNKEVQTLMGWIVS